jgi:hypothetical protein
MKTISMLDLRNDSESIVSQLKKGVSMLLTYRGKKLAVLSPYHEEYATDSDSDPLFAVCEHAIEAPDLDKSKSDDDLIYDL